MVQKYHELGIRGQWRINRHVDIGHVRGWMFIKHICLHMGSSDHTFGVLGVYPLSLSNKYLDIGQVF